MGSRPYAVLAYGYDISNEINSYDAGPAWHDDEDAGRYDNAARALLAAVGTTVSPGEYFNPESVEKLCGVALIKLGYSEEAGVFLAVEHHKTDWDDNIQVPSLSPRQRPNLDRLAWALEVLGFERNTEPTWLLGAYYG